MFTDTLNITYTPKLALVVYERNENQDVDSNNAPDFHLESCDFFKNDGQYHLSAGSLLQEKQLNELAKFLSKREQKRLEPYSFKGIIPSNVIYTSQKLDAPAVIWSKVNPCEKLMFTKELGIPDGIVKLPNLVFTLHGHSLKVFAFKATQLKESTPLFRAPFHNTQESGVCLGNVKIQCRTRYWEDLIKATEDAFFNSLFSHIHGDNPVKRSYNLNTILTNCIQNDVPFPNQALAKSKMKLPSLINSLS